MMVLRLYIDLMSQPSRAIALFLRANSISYEEVQVALRKQEHKSPNYAKINPFLKVPAIEHDGFKLVESSAILQYLCRSFNVSDHWYPSDTKKMAIVDSYMAWQHLNVRINAALLFRTKLESILSGNPVNEKKVASLESGLKIALSQIESIWLKDRPFIATDQVTIADLVAVTELEQPGMIGFDVRQENLRVGEYMDLVKSQLQPHYDNVHDVAFKVAEKLKVKQQVKK